MRRALYSGSFDPITFGHLDIIERISSQFDEITVLVAGSLSKKYLFSVDERVEMISHCTRSLSNAHRQVRVVSTDGLLIDYAKENGIKTIIRGLRAISDFEYEYAMANINSSLAAEVETMIIFTRPQYSFIASRMVKEVASHGGGLEKFVPSYVIERLEAKRKEGKL